MPYSIASDESEEDNTYISYNKVIGTSLDEKLYLAFEVLIMHCYLHREHRLREHLRMPGSEKTLWDRMTTEFTSRSFSVIAKNANVEQKEAFCESNRGYIKRYC